MPGPNPLRLALSAAMLLAGTAGTPAQEAPVAAASLECRDAARSTPENRAWWTIYYGERGRVIAGVDVREWTREVRCFTSEAACLAWLEEARTIWPDRGFARPCRAGLPPWLAGPQT